MESVEQNLETVSHWVQVATDFAVQYGFQILGALAFFLFGFIAANWIGNRIEQVCLSRNIDQTLSQFVGSTTKLILIILLVIITLGNFGISIAPLIALAGAATFGATLALQGPLSNFGSGLAIIATRPFVVGNVLTVHGVSGVVDRITLGATFLTGEDGESITIPNKEIVGQVLVNSQETRIVETKLALSTDEDIHRATALILEVIAACPDIITEPAPQAGVQDFTYGGVVIGIRYWVPGRQYFQVRYAVNGQILDALKKAGIPLLCPEGAAMPLGSLESTASNGPARPVPPGA
ncbi:mechanosensitive ion channel family protein [Sneathiella chinensis]|uniref:Small-conductance mechanosensitive channel n=1 Tax=Sneathiella chinensis TaxID=349750 RepID=A0ABQ5U3H9_9PROT|nr:mechanosensitive ion channel family protein [Sneathiella chinensis]GLQ05740.1 mechanosensitive ion channel protein MscS [Sneathiella chinensis]